MQKEIRLKYSWLKQRRKNVLEFLEQNYWIKKDTTSKTPIENGLGITGDDADEMLQDFQQRFHVDMSELNFFEYFYNESELGDFVPLLFILVLIKLFLLPFAILALPFSFSTFKELITYNFFNEKEDKGKKNLTVGDLITSSFTHKFTLQKDVCIRLV